MATRKVKDAKDLETDELIYFKSHAKATYMSDGISVEDTITKIKEENLIFIGTQNEYEAAYALGKIKNGCLVIILDENELGGDSEENLTTAILGLAVVGKMKLGTN